MGTSTNDTLALQAGDYVAMLPFESSDTRVKHVGLISDQDIRIEIESGLMDLSNNILIHRLLDIVHIHFLILMNWMQPMVLEDFWEH